MRQSFTPFVGQANLPTRENIDGMAHSGFTFIIGCISVPEKRIAWALLSLLSFAGQHDLTESGNVDFVPDKLRSNESSTFMKSICLTC